MFLLISYQSNLNFDQFDLNFGQIIYSYSGQFASTATTTSLSSSRDFLCRLKLREIRGEMPYALSLVSLFAFLRDWYGIFR